MLWRALGRPESCGGDASESPPQEFSYVAIVHIKRYTKNYKCVIISEKGALISAWKCT